MALQLFHCLQTPTAYTSSAPVVLTETRNDSYLLCKWLASPFFQRPTLGANVNFSASNGLYIDIPVLWPAPYLKFRTLPGAYKRQSVNVEGEVYRRTGCIISSRASPNLHWHSVSSQPPSSPRPAGLDFSPAYICIACMYCLHCGSRKTGGRGSTMRSLCYSLGAGSRTSSWLRLLLKIMCSALYRHARSRALKMLLTDVAVSKNLPLWCQFFLEILRGAPDVVLIWFGLDVASASFSVTRTLQS